jgi:hypothetical protein
MKNREKVRFWVMVLWLGIVLLAFLPRVGSAIPQKMNYQGYLTNAAGVPINGTVQMVFSIYNVSSGGTPPLWTETHSVTVSQGVYSVILGEGTIPNPINLPFDTTYYLGVQVGTDPEMTPRKILTSVGYAFQALNSEMLGGQKLSDLDNRYGQAFPVQNPRSNTLTIVDSGNDVGQYSSITIGTDGLPVISYNDGAYHALKVAKCGDASCSSGNTLTIVDTGYIVGGGTGHDTSITIGTDGLPVISYLDRTNFDLKVAHCGNASCSSGNIITTVDSGYLGYNSSITICTDGLPVISYYDLSNHNLKVAKCGNAACSSGNTLSTIDPEGTYSSITIGTDGLPIISYCSGYLPGYLKVNKCGNAACSSGNTITTIDSGGTVFYYTSITIGTDGLPIISYYDYTNGDLKVAKCGNVACSSGNTITTIDSGGNVGLYSSITIGTDGLPVISYLDYGNMYLKVAKCGNAACSSGNTITIVDSGTFSEYTSITIGTDGLPVISYESNDKLKVAKCANPFCLNNWSRR